MTDEAPDKDDAFAAYLGGLIASTQAEIASLDAVQASVAQQTESMRELITALEENEGVREQLFRWIAERRPQTITRLAMDSAHGGSAMPRWDERLVAAMRSAQPRNGIEVERVAGHLAQSQLGAPAPADRHAVAPEVMSPEASMNEATTIRTRFAN
jgi:hypothetical protein